MNYDVMPLIHNISHARRNAARTHLEPLGISPGQPAVLRYLAEHDGSIQKDIADNCKVRAASVVSVLDGLERNGWVRRSPHESDRRAWQIYLTEKGREICKDVHEIFEQLDNECLDGITESELISLRDTLTKISSNLQKSEGTNEKTP